MPQSTAYVELEKRMHQIEERVEEIPAEARQGINEETKQLGEILNEMKNAPESEVQAVQERAETTVSNLEQKIEEALRTREAGGSGGPEGKEKGSKGQPPKRQP